MRATSRAHGTTASTAEHLVPAGVAIDADEFAADGVIWAADAIRVKAFAVDHEAGVGPACGYRIEHGDRAVVLAGDTRFSEAVIGNAAGADLLVHGTAAAAPHLMTAGHVRRILAVHTSPAEVATVFSRARPTMAVLARVVLLGSSETAAPMMDHVVAAIRTGYRGPVTVGEDLMSFDLAEHTVLGAPHVRIASPLRYPPDDRASLLGRPATASSATSR